MCGALSTAVASRSWVPVVELPELDLESLRSAFAEGARCIVAPHRAGLLAHPWARDLAEIAPSFHFTWRGSCGELPARLAAALRSAAPDDHRTREALVAEIAHLV